MSLSFHVGEKRYEIGSSSFLKSFFSTVFVRLEKEDWGSRYPTVMQELYSGKLSHFHAGAAENELASIREGLTALTPDAVIWDFEDRGAKPPWGDAISPGINSLGNYFVTSDGKDLISVMREASRAASREKKDVEIR